LDIPQGFLRFSQVIGLCFPVITIILVEKYSNLFFIPYEIIGIFILVTLLIVLAKALLKKRESSFLVFSAVLFVILIAGNDILNSYGIISIGYYIPLGVFLFKLMD